MKIFEREPGNGRVAARLILNSGTVEEAESVIERFKEMPNKTDEAYPYAAIADRMIETDLNEATDLFLELNGLFPQLEVKAAEMYVHKHRRRREAVS